VSEKSSGATVGVGFFGLLTLLFVGLKLTGCIGWSWWWVLSPLFASWFIYLSVIVIAFALLVRAETSGRRK
jgi:hypothetical protein